MAFDWRATASSGLVRLAVSRCLIATMDRTKWLELGTITNTRQALQDHPRLLRSLYFGDDDYDACVMEVASVVLGEAPGSGGIDDLRNLDLVAEFLDLPAWLAANDESLLRRLYEVEESSASVLPDGTVMTSVETAAARLDVDEMRRQVTRIRRDYESDPEAAIGASKELVETVCKTILGHTGRLDTMDDVPKLVKQTLIHLGLDAATVAARDNDTAEAHALKRVLGGVSSILNGADELRNTRGTGHGRSGAPPVNEPLARLAVGLVLPAVNFLVEAYEAQIVSRLSRHAEKSQDEPIEGGALRPGSVVRHVTFGDGDVTAVEGTGESEVVSVDFGPGVGHKRLLRRYAPLTLLER